MLSKQVRTTMNGKANQRMVKAVIPVMDLETGRRDTYAGWRENGFTFVLPHGETYPRRVAYVNVGPSEAAYVFPEHLKADPGLFSYSKRNGGR